MFSSLFHMGKSTAEATIPEPALQCPAELQQCLPALCSQDVDVSFRISNVPDSDDFVTGLRNSLEGSTFAGATVERFSISAAGRLQAVAFSVFAICALALYLM